MAQWWERLPPMRPGFDSKTQTHDGISAPTSGAFDWLTWCGISSDILKKDQMPGGFSGGGREGVDDHAWNCLIHYSKAADSTILCTSFQLE